MRCIKNTGSNGQSLGFKLGKQRLGQSAACVASKWACSSNSNSNNEQRGKTCSRGRREFTDPASDRTTGSCQPIVLPQDHGGSQNWWYSRSLLQRAATGCCQRQMLGLGQHAVYLTGERAHNSSSNGSQMSGASPCLAGGAQTSMPLKLLR